MKKQGFRCFDNIDRPAFAVLTSAESDLSAFAPVFWGEYAEKSPNDALEKEAAKIRSGKDLYQVKGDEILLQMTAG